MTKPDLDRQVAPQKINRRGNRSKYLLVAIGSVMTTLGLVGVSTLLYNLLGQKHYANNQLVNSSQTSPSIQPAQFVQPAFGNQAQVELTSVRRIPGSLDEVSVEMRISRLSGDALASDIINTSGTIALNPITKQRYQAIDPIRRASVPISLYQIRQGEPVEARVVLRVPPDVKAIDIYVDDAQPFKNVPIASADRANMEANNFPFSEATTPDATTQTAVELSQTNSQSPQVVASRATIQPIHLVQNAFGHQAQIELLSVKRVRDPELRTLDLVDIQMRVRRIEPKKVDGAAVLDVGSIVVRNPDTNETYPAVKKTVRNGIVDLYAMRPGASADADVWLRVPEKVNSLDIFIPETAAFKNVPIAN